MPFDLEALYNLLPAFYRAQEAGLGRADQAGPLKELLALIAESTAVLEDDLNRLYDDQFIETCAEWAVPYIGDLIGYRRLDTLSQAELPAELKRQLSERSQVANTLRYRRRKGTLAVLEDLARDVTGWEAKAVEYFQQLAVSQHLNHVRLGATLADIRHMAGRAKVGTPFDTTAHTAEMRPIANGDGRYNLPNIGIFLWRLRAVAVDAQPASADPADSRYFRFSPLRADMPLFAAPEPEDQVSHLAEAENVPRPISRRALHDDLNRAGGSPVLYGPSGSLILYADGRAVPAEEIKAANLSDNPATGTWAHHPANHYAIDPELGRITVPTSAGAPARLEVSYRYGAPGQLGTVLDQAVLPELHEGTLSAKVPDDQALLGDALVALKAAKYAEVLITNNDAYASVPDLHVEKDHILAVRAAAGTRPTLLLTQDWQLSGAQNGEIVLEGLLVSGAALRVPSIYDLGAGPQPNQLRRLHLRHCTLVPGLALNPDGSPQQPGVAGLIIEASGVTVVIEDCIIGGLRADVDSHIELHTSVCDAGNPEAVAYAAPDDQSPGGPLTAENCTIIGRVHAYTLEQVSNTLFVSRFAPGDSWTKVSAGAAPAAPVRAERRQVGCVRHSFVPLGSRTPRRSACHPADKAESIWLWPRFTSLRYNSPGYAQLSGHNPDAIWRGTDDQASLGVYHNLYEPQRLANLRTRLNEYLRFGLEAGMFLIPE